MTRVFFDMDGVLAEYKDVPLEELYKKGYFADLKPIEETLNAIKILSEDPQFEVHTLSAVLPENPYALDANQMTDIDIEGFDLYKKKAPRIIIGDKR